MQIELNEIDQAFREEVRSFLAANLPQKISDRVKRGYSVSKEEMNEWTRTLNQQGWAAPNWPVAYGGTGWSMVKRHLFDIECRLAHAPVLSGFGFNMVGPAIIAYGSEEQKARYLPQILNSEVWWCQGYSEPQAGSDLATVRTSARRDGDDYVINGSKIWTSGAELADRIFLLARTDPDVKPQLGISFLLMDMNLPGVTVEPLIAFNGKRLWNQVFFDDVRIPCTEILGRENQGWTVAKNLLGNERLLVSRVAENRRLLGRNIEIIEEEAAQGRFFEESLLKRLTELKIRLEALDSTFYVEAPGQSACSRDGSHCL